MFFDLLPFLLTILVTVLGVVGVGWKVILVKVATVSKELNDVFQKIIEVSQDNDFSKDDIEAIKVEVEELLAALKDFRNLKKNLAAKKSNVLGKIADVKIQKARDIKPIVKEPK